MKGSIVNKTVHKGPVAERVEEGERVEERWSVQGWEKVEPVGGDVPAGGPGGAPVGLGAEWGDEYQEVEDRDDTDLRTEVFHVMVLNKYKNKQKQIEDTLKY